MSQAPLTMQGPLVLQTGMIHQGSKNYKVEETKQRMQNQSCIKEEKDIIN